MIPGTTPLADRVDHPTRRVRWRRTIRFVARLAKSDGMIAATATLAAAYIRLVGATSPIAFEPRSAESVFDEFAPFIVTSWHGRALFLPLFRPRSRPVDVLVSRHSDGEVAARMLTKLGCGIVRGSGAADPAHVVEKGGVAAFIGMKAALAQGRSVVMTADSSGSAKGKVGPGLIALARASGRPIVPVAITTRRRLVVDSWDRANISLPFGRIACVIAEPVTVPASADEALLEGKRCEVEAALTAATARAREIADRRRG